MSKLNPAIFKAYDIRATYPDNINEEVMVDIVRAIYSFLAKKIGKTDISIGLGRDMRISSPTLYDVAKKTLVACGAQVKEIGLASTPTVYFAVRYHSYDAGIQISASHNPKEYNGIKIVLRDGKKLVKIGKETGMNEIKEFAVNQTYNEYTNTGSSEIIDSILGEEVSQALDAIAPGDLSKLSFVSDPANAMGILPVEELFSRLDTHLVKINFELDGTFPAHQADPLQFKTLRQLQDKVIEVKADLGICTDGDGDRVMFIDNKGDIIPATYITALIAREILKDEKGARILVDIRYIRNVKSIVEKFGGEVGYTKVGHALITAQVNRENAAFAGESSGHYYFRSMGGCESSIRVILYILRVMADEKRPISDIIDELRSSVESGEYNFEFPHDVSVPDFLKEVIEQYKDGELSTLDGIAIDYPDWRFSIRTSNTEPLLRLNIEGISEEIVKNKVDELSKKILATGATVKE
ncbi:phosphomannomutase/phosphoglucomutase [soil metagenome]